MMTTEGNGKQQSGHAKPTLAMYWAASCGGCEISLLNIGLHLLDVDAAFELVFLPCIADFKYEDVRGYPDGYIDVCLFNGAIRTEENLEMAHLLRRKSKILVAYGACASQGSIPALANLSQLDDLFKAAYLDNPSTVNPEGLLPRPTTTMVEGQLELPDLLGTVRSLDQVVDVDYYLPGCPPESTQVWAVVETLISVFNGEAELPPTGAVLGAGTVAVCEECSRVKQEKKISHFYRPFEKQPDADTCLLEQGLFCMGPATRCGCGARCPSVGMGCRGCYGPLDGVEDQGARMLSAIASLLDVGAPGDGEQVLDRRMTEVLDSLPDPAGTLYRFSLSHSLLRRARPAAEG